MDFPIASCADPVHGEVPPPCNAVVVSSGVTKKPIYLLAGCNVTFVIRPMSVQHRLLWAFQQISLQQVPMWHAGFPSLKYKAPCCRHSQLKVTNFWNMMSSVRLTVLFLILFSNYMESGQERWWYSVLKPENFAEIYQ